MQTPFIQGFEGFSHGIGVSQVEPVIPELHTHIESVEVAAFSKGMQSMVFAAKHCVFATLQGS